MRQGLAIAATAAVVLLVGFAGRGRIEPRRRR